MFEKENITFLIIIQEIYPKAHSVQNGSEKEWLITISFLHEGKEEQTFYRDSQNALGQIK